VIREVLALLGQQPPADLAGAGAAEALSWAAAHWRRDRLPQAGAVPRAAPAA
jgi:glutamyl-Q tRNA(Asp) synthetase